MSVTDQIKEKMKAAIDHLKMELKSIRTGRANPGMVDTIQVEVYGSMMKLKDIASISSPEPKQLLITPFDGKNAPFISKAIEKANIGIQPILDGNSVRLKIPPMDDSQRKKMIELCHKKREEAKVSIRNIRREGNDHLKKQKKEAEIPEDLFKKHEQTIQKLTDECCKEADTISHQKEAEVAHI